MNNIKKIVLTGGPCAGKTTAMVKVIEHFSSLGYKVFTIPEVPTMFTQAGMNYLTSNKDFFFEGEKATFMTQVGLEIVFCAWQRQWTSQCSSFATVERWTSPPISPLSFGIASSRSRVIPTLSYASAMTQCSIWFRLPMAQSSSIPLPIMRSDWRRQMNMDFR